MATTQPTPAAIDAAASRVSSMSYADLYGAGDDTGPSSSVAGSFGYVAATEAEGTNTPPSIAASDAEGGLAALVNLGHELIDTPYGLSFLVAGGLLLILWSDLA